MIVKIVAVIGAQETKYPTTVQQLSAQYRPEHMASHNSFQWVSLQVVVQNAYGMIRFGNGVVGFMAKQNCSAFHCYRFFIQSS